MTPAVHLLVFEGFAGWEPPMRSRRCGEAAARCVTVGFTPCARAIHGRHPGRARSGAGRRGAGAGPPADAAGGRPVGGRRRLSARAARGAVAPARARQPPIAAICGATLAAARAGLLEDRAHTSNETRLSPADPLVRRVEPLRERAGCARPRSHHGQRPRPHGVRQGDLRGARRVAPRTVGCGTTCSSADGFSRSRPAAGLSHRVADARPTRTRSRPPRGTGSTTSSRPASTCCSVASTPASIPPRRPSLRAAGKSVLAGAARCGVHRYPGETLAGAAVLRAQGSASPTWPRGPLLRPMSSRRRSSGAPGAGSVRQSPALPAGLRGRARHRGVPELSTTARGGRAPAREARRLRHLGAAQPQRPQRQSPARRPGARLSRTPAVRGRSVTRPSRAVP